MKTNRSLLLRIQVLILCVTFTVPAAAGSLEDACASAKSLTDARCYLNALIVEQNANDIYNSAYDTAQALYTATLQSDADTKVSEDNTAHEALLGFINTDTNVDPLGSCIIAELQALQDATNSYTAATNACSGDSSCECLALADLNFLTDQATGSVLEKCRRPPDNDYHNTEIPADQAEQDQNDDNAGAAFSQTAGDAWGLCMKTTDIAEANKNACLTGSYLDNANCMLNADCSENSANCCIDACGVTKNTKYKQAQMNYITLGGNAQGSADYGIQYCYAKWQHDYDVSLGTYEHDLDVENGAYQHARTAASDKNIEFRGYKL